MRYTKYIVGGAAGVVLFVALSQWSQQHAELLTELTNQAGVIGVVSYVAILAASIIFAPLGTGFLLPVAANSYGPVLAAVYSILGWTIGSVGSFWVARHFGFEKLKKTPLIQRIHSYESSVPRRYFYGLIVLFRMALPVDAVSYALGFASTISYPAFLVTTVLGITPMAFVFVFAATSSMAIQITVSVLTTLLFLVATYFVYREYIQTSPKNDTDSNGTS
jgi:uncharacterized membrane protein YdjX (TVP38/TMEM64 family)